jgi:hypothetical protein
VSNLLTAKPREPRRGTASITSLRLHPKQLRSKVVQMAKPAKEHAPAKRPRAGAGSGFALDMGEDAEDREFKRA